MHAVSYQIYGNSGTTTAQQGQHRWILADQTPSGKDVVLIADEIAPGRP